MSEHNKGIQPAAGNEITTVVDVEFSAGRHRGYREPLSLDQTEIRAVDDQLDAMVPPIIHINTHLAAVVTPAGEAPPVLTEPSARGRLKLAVNNLLDGSGSRGVATLRRRHAGKAVVQKGPA